MIHIQKFIFNPFQENTYVVRNDSGCCLIIDPGCCNPREEGRIMDFIAANSLRPMAILLTHAHLDHICGLQSLSGHFGIPVYMDGRERESIEGFNPTMSAFGLPEAGKFDFTPVSDGELIEFGDMRVRVLSTPGHSMGGVCWWLEDYGIIFSGDTLFAGSIGRTDNKWASWDTLKASIKNTLMALDGEIDVYPGHGPATSIGQERLTNPFINDEFGELGYEL